MPELPELAAHAERVAADYGGSELEKFTALGLSALKTFDPRPDDAVGLPLTGVGRRGKYLLLGFGDDLTFAVHLMQGGRLRADPKQARRPRGGLARWRFADGRALLLTEAGTEHRAGVWVLRGDPLPQEPLVDLGPEADAVDEATLAELLADHSMRLHGWLRDQRIVAGLGRRLANEVCWHAQLSPFATTAKLDAGQVRAVHAAMGEAVAASLAEERERDDMSASKHRSAAVHGHAGDPCPRCGDPVRAVEYRSYTVNYCATCQTGGKVLADNTTSRFLK